MAWRFEKQRSSHIGWMACRMSVRVPVSLVRIERLVAGLLGDVKPVGEGVSEMRIHYGPGYRVYFMRRGRELIILLAGGDKRTQARDIHTALLLARNLG